MHDLARRFLSLRALGAPAVVVSLALQGILRGFKDTKTPVLCLGKSSVYFLNIGCNVWIMWRSSDFVGHLFYL